MTDYTDEQLEVYRTSPGWYEYPGVDKKLRRAELIEVLDGDEFDGPTQTAISEDGDIVEEKVEYDTTVPDESPAGFVPVGRGQKGHRLRVVRSLLSIAGYPAGTKSYFDGVDERAVLEYQHARRIPQTGEVDQQTWNQLAFRG